jgi:hypothetical protein
MTTEAPKARLCKALVEAQRQARALYKDAKNKHHDYNYVSAEAIIDESRKALNAAGLAFDQEEVSFYVDERGIARIKAIYSLSHESGEEKKYRGTFPVLPGKGRPEDKAESSAVTTLLAYTLRGVLLIPRDDQAAAIDQRDDSDYEPRRESESKREEPRASKAALDLRAEAGEMGAAPRASVENDGCPTKDIDPAHVAMAREIVRRAVGSTLSDIGDLAAEAKRAKFPAELENWTLAELRAHYNGLKSRAA